MNAPPAETVPRAAWRMLGLGVAAQAAGVLLTSIPAYLIPLLHVERGESLASAGWLAAAPNIGLVFTLVLWGVLADRYAERWVLVAGLALSSGFALVAAPVDDLWWLAGLLLLGGGATACTSATSGKIVAAWFPRSRRGLAMGIRQMSQPLGVAVAALVVPPLAGRFGTGAPLLLAGICLGVLAFACAVGIANGPAAQAQTDPGTPLRASAGLAADRSGPASSRPGAKGDVHASSGLGTDRDAPASPVDPNPYRGNRFLARIHLVSLLLVVPQFTLSTFGLVWLTVGQGWDPTAAGLMIAIAQFTGGIGRILVGSASDRVGSRVRVLRLVAVSCVLVMLALAVTSALDRGLVSGILLIVATTVSVADNGLAFTSIVEAAGSSWSGKAVGIQNTGQYVAASAVGPGIGALIALAGYPLAFALVAVMPLLSIPLVPARDQHRTG
ncbi:MFS transporter [Kineosporia succinea]|uniref:MFS family permease n=1 Tax=Kineosporia succinea TaxID=84632 RepID=A0ABT9P705_9ACTN|nr:MFS transporter [Kineosporia succinea]MDP9828476.1 MFS family permease [Kineosporia succinea]